MAQSGTDKLEEAIAQLVEMTPEKREEYCKAVINSLADAAEAVAKLDSKIAQARATKQLLKELAVQRDEILPVVFYIIKPEFRETVQNLMDRFSGYTDNI